MTLAEAVEFVIVTKAWRSGINVDGLYLDCYNGNVLYLSNRAREVTKQDVEALRAAILDNGYREVKSWVAYQGQSWLTPGIFTGVSFQVEKVADA